jgi:hypothetical protein
VGKPIEHTSAALEGVNALSTFLSKVVLVRVDSSEQSSHQLWILP